MEKDPEKSFRWIIGILNNHNIPFQVDGGLAARAYGADRELVDIDLVIPENRFNEIISEVEPFIIYGPSHFIDDKWDVFMMTLDHHGQVVDLVGAEDQKFFDHEHHEWKQMKTDFSDYGTGEVFGEKVQLIPKDKLIAQKEALGREVDLIDLEFLRK